MTDKQLKRAREVESDIFQTQRDIEDLKKVIDDYDNFGSTITFLRNSDRFSRSFGSKKNNFRKRLLELITELKSESEKKLIQLKEEFKNI